MHLTFLGTRGYIEANSPRHRRHSLLQITCAGRRVLIDCGEDWLGEVTGLRPDAVFLTHAHPDHAWGLRQGAPCPVFATAETWGRIEEYPIADRRTIVPRQPVTFGHMTIEAFPLQHSIRAPAVGYRVSTGATSVFYAPDVVYIPDRAEALQGCLLYIGDGATVTDSFVRKEGDQLFGHTPVRTQLTWCRKEGVPKMLVTHCGEEIVTGEEKGILEEIALLARQRNVEVEVAWDGMEIQL